MLEIPLFVLVIQIEFHAALNNRGYSSSPLIPILRNGNSEQRRRLADSNSYLISRGLSASNVMPEPEYASFEDYSSRSHQPVQYPYQRRNDDLRYSARPENDVSLDTAPVGRINSNNNTESIQSSPSSSHRTYPNYRRPYSARGPTNLEQGQTRKKNDNSSLDVLFLEDASREEANSLLSLMEKSFIRRGQNRKFYRKDLSTDASPRRRFNRKSNGNSRSSLHDQSFPEDDKTGKLNFMRLSSLEDLNLEPPLLRSQDQNELNNRKSNSRNFLRLSLLPNNKLTLDEGIASDLSELLSEALEELNLVSLRRTGPSSNKYSRRENRPSAEEDDLTNPSDLRVGSLDILDSELPTRRNSESEYHSSKKNLRRHGNNRAALKKQFDEDTAKTLVPYHEGNHKKIPNSRRNGNKNNNKKDDFSDEFSLDTLFDFRKDGHDDSLNLNDKLSSDLSVLRSKNPDNLSLKSLLRSSDENESKTTDLLNLEYPWTDVLSPNKNKTSGLRSLTQLRTGEQDDKIKDSSDALHLEFPWNDILSPGRNKSGKSNLKSPKQKENKKDTTAVLHLRYPWNDQLSPDNNKSNTKSELRSKSVLRSPKKEDNIKDSTDTLHLEFPMNDELSADNRKSSKQSILPGLRSKSMLRSPKQKDDKKDATDVLHLRYPWNDQLSPDNNKSNTQSELRSKSVLRSPKKEDNIKDSTDTLHLEFPWNDELSADNRKSSKQSILPGLRSKSMLRSPKQKDDKKDATDVLHLRYPWNDQLSPDNNKSNTQSELRSKSVLRSPKKEDNIKDSTDTLHLEFPWNDELSADNRKSSKQSILPGLRSKSMLRSPKQKDDKKDATDVLHLQYPWNDQLSPDNNKSKQLRSHDQEDNVKVTSDTLHLEFPWNDDLSPDENKTGKSKSLRRQTDSRDKEPKDEMKLELSKTNQDKPSSKKTAVRTPDPFYVHPFLRNRNIKKHPNYFKRSYDDFSEGVRLENHKNSPLKRSNSPSRRSNRRLMDSQNRRVLPIMLNARAGYENHKYSVSVESPSVVITLPSNRIHRRLRVRTRRQNDEPPPVVTTTETPNNLIKLIN